MSFAAEVLTGERFAFGKNWQRYLQRIDEAGLEAAKTSLVSMLGELGGRTFLDVGCGSGLFSLAATQLGAIVHSFDYDPVSVECTRELKRRFAPLQNDWIIQEGSVLDAGFLRQLGQFDLIYCWGVLHHTGDLLTASDNVAGLVKVRGRLWLAIYNDQGKPTRVWKSIKRTYNRSLVGKALVTAFGFAFFAGRGLVGDLLRMRNPFTRYHQGHARGMAVFTDWIDWLGGWPFEVAKPEQIFEFYTKRGFVLDKLRTRAGGMGCNEFVFTKTSVTGE
jgi:SAM-dependent methyltransferase